MKALTRNDRNQPSDGLRFAQRAVGIWLICVALGAGLLLLMQPAITPAEHRDAVAVFVPNRVIDGTERLSPAARTDVCVMEREAWLRRKYSVQPANDFARFLVYSFARVNCLLH